jgi:hypothetical protein
MALRNDGANAEHTWCVLALALELVKLPPVAFANLVSI